MAQCGADFYRPQILMAPQSQRKPYFVWISKYWNILVHMCTIYEVSWSCVRWRKCQALWVTIITFRGDKHVPQYIQVFYLYVNINTGPLCIIAKIRTFRVVKERLENGFLATSILLFRGLLLKILTSKPKLLISQVAAANACRNPKAPKLAHAMCNVQLAMCNMQHKPHSKWCQQR